MTISTNGYISFGADSVNGNDNCGYSAESLPTNSCYDGPYIFPFFTDLVMENGEVTNGHSLGARTCFYKKNTAAPANWVFEWDSIGVVGCDSAVNLKFEVICYSSGNIKLQYANMNYVETADDGEDTCVTDYVIGLQSNDLCTDENATALQYSYDDERQPSNGRAVWLYLPQWTHNYKTLSIISPDSTDWYVPGASLSVQAIIQNRGTTTERTTPKYKFNTSAVVTGANSSSLAEWATQTYSFATAITLPTTPGWYNLWVSSGLSTDLNRADDTCFTRVHVYDCRASIPWSENFDGVTPPSLPTCWRAVNLDTDVVNGCNSPTTWRTNDAEGGHSGSNALYIDYDCPLDNWAFLPPFTLTSGTQYYLKYWARVESGDDCPETFSLRYGTARTVAAMTHLITNDSSYCNSHWKLFAYSFTPTASGTYYIGIHATSEYHSGIYLDDLWFGVTPAIGRCCYGDSLNPTCAVNSLSACASLQGKWIGGEDCTTQPCPILPPNDLCVNATVIADGQTVTGNSANATADCSYGAPDVWVKFTTTTCSYVTLSLCGSLPSMTDYTYETTLYSGCPCSGPFNIHSAVDSLCSDGNQTLTWWQVPAGTYYYPIYGDSDYWVGDYSVHLSLAPCPPPPSNDDCAGATVLGYPSVTPGTTYSATADPAAPACPYSSFGPAVWYKITGNGDKVTAAVCQASFYPYVNIYSGTCAALTCVSTANNYAYCSGGSWTSHYTWCTLYGTDYYLLVQGYGSNTMGDFSLEFADSGSCNPIMGWDYGDLDTTWSSANVDAVCPHMTGTETTGGPANAVRTQNIAWLGAAVSADPTPAIPNQDGYDDGVTFFGYPGPMWNPCTPESVAVDVHAGPGYGGQPLYLYGWKNGDPQENCSFDDILCDGQAPECLINGVQILGLTAGHDTTIHFTFLDPGSTNYGPYDGIFRFRLLSRQLAQHTAQTWVDSLLGETEDYVLGDIQLSVDLISFEAAQDGGAVQLDWATASERNSDHFVIQRKVSGAWQPVGNRLPAAGSSVSTRHYRYRDETVQAGCEYSYRLIVVDVDGVSQTLGERRVQVSQQPLTVTEYKLYANYPNPFNPTTTIAFDLKNAGHVTLQVYDIMGQLVTTLIDGNRSSGRYHVEFNAGNLPSGLYLYRLQTPGFTDMKKMVLLK